MRALAAAAIVALCASRTLAVDVSSCAAPTLADPNETSVPAGQTGVQANLSGCHYAVVLANSTITGNNGFAAGHDLLLPRRPRFEGVTCESSLRASGVTWGVCSDD